MVEFHDKDHDQNWNSFASLLQTCFLFEWNIQKYLEKPSGLIDMVFMQGSLLVIISLVGTSVEWISVWNVTKVYYFTTQSKKNAECIGSQANRTQVKHKFLQEYGNVNLNLFPIWSEGPYCLFLCYLFLYREGKSTFYVHLWSFFVEY